MRLRQLVFVAERLAPAEEELCGVLGLEVAFRDPGVGRWGLENIVVPLGGNFLEIVAPVAENTSAGRYLTRRGGNGGYMVILQCPDALAERKRVTDLGVRAVHMIDRTDYPATHFHPADVGGILLSIDSVEPKKDYLEPRCSWPPAGKGWEKAIRPDVVSDFSAVELQSDDPEGLAELWSRVLGLSLQAGNGGHQRIELDNAHIRFVAATDGRGNGFGGIDVKAADPRKVLEAAEARGLKRSDTQVMVCGTRVNLV